MRPIFLLNSPVLTDWGKWEFQSINIESARLLLNNGFESAIGHQASAEFLSQLLDLEIPKKRQQINMKAGDKALVLRLKQRLPEGILLNKAQLEQIPFELGLLIHQ